MRPLLLPGSHLLRRDARTLQVGLDPDSRVLLPDAPAHRRLLSERPGTTTLAALSPLLLDDDAALRAALPPAATSDPESVWRRHSLASAAREGRPLVHHGVLVLVQGYGGSFGEHLADDFRTLLRRSSLPAQTRRPPGPQRQTSEEVHVVVGVGEPPRELLDDRVSSDTPHLVVRYVEGRVVVGPFVVSGHTACLRCLDLHRTERDPAWPLLMEQYTRLTRQDRPDGVPEPVDAALVAVASGWAVRDVSAYLAGARPLTWSRTMTMTPDLADIELQDWPARPDCGCEAP